MIAAVKTAISSFGQTPRALCRVFSRTNRCDRLRDALNER